MNKLLRIVRIARQTKNKRRSLFGADWMRGQLTRMTALNQGLVSMSLGK